jgi:hypothetical protein
MRIPGKGNGNRLPYLTREPFPRRDSGVPARVNA